MIRIKRYCFLCFFIAIGLLNECNRIKKNRNDEIKWSIEMADAVMSRYDSLVYYNNPKSIKWQYDIAMLGQAIDRLGNIDKKYSKYYEDFINYFINENGSIKKYKKEDYNLDNINPAKGLITIYKRTGDEKYLKAINEFISQLEKQPRTASGGFWHKKKYPNQMWLDGIYMSSPFIAQYAIEFNQPQWLDTVVKQITIIYNATLDKETGLLFHAWDESHQQQWSNPETGCSPNIWGRAMGWYLMALVDVLDYIPENYIFRDTLINILNNTSKAILNVRDPETSLWNQVLDKGNKEGNYNEASCSSMFVYAFAKGAKKGYLSKKYLKNAENSFVAIIKRFIFEDEDKMFAMKDVCGSAGLGGEPYRDGSYQYYIAEKKMENDPKGIAPFIMAAIELDR